MGQFKISKGYNIPIMGEAEKKTDHLPLPPFVGLHPNEFPGVKPKLLVEVNDEVKAGTPLFFDKRQESVKFGAPTAGRITAINYGPRRVIEEIIISTSEKQESESFETFSKEQLKGADKEKLVSHLQESCMWPVFRQRPFNKIANPEQMPKSIFVNCMETAPIANDPNYSLADFGDDFAMGIAALQVLCSNVHVAVHQNHSDTFKKAEGASFHTFSGPHPAGLVGTHINKVDPINRGEVVWYVNGRDVVAIGQLLASGKFPSERIVAVTGMGSKRRQYFKTVRGIQLKNLVGEHLAEGENRIISGNVLTGTKRPVEAFLGFYDDLVTVIPEGGDQEFLGWMAPGFNKQSFTRALASGFLPGKKFNMNANVNGSVRAIVQSEVYEKVVAIDIQPEFLIKATIVNDIEAMEHLGILEVAPEDFALCSYVCSSKTEVTEIIREGLELMEKEG